MKYIRKSKNVSNHSFVLDLNDGVEVNPKIKGLNITKVLLYNTGIQKYFLEKKYLITIKKILKLIMDSDGSDSENILYTIEQLESIILLKYNGIFSKEEIQKMLKELLNIKQNITLREYKTSRGSR